MNIILPMAQVAPKFRAAPVSGFFLHHATIAGVGAFEARARWVFATMNSSSGVNAQCIAALQAEGADHQNETWRCFFANTSYAHTTTPIFVLNSAVDAFQMQAILNVSSSCASLAVASHAGPQFNNCTVSDLRAVRAYESDFLRDLETSGDTFHRAGSGGFVESCLEHVAAQGGDASTIVSPGAYFYFFIISYN